MKIMATLLLYLKNRKKMISVKRTLTIGITYLMNGANVK